MKKVQMTSEGVKDEFDSYIPQQLPYTNLVSREQYIHNYYTNYLPYTTQGNISDPTASWSSNANDSIAYISSYDINPYDQFSFGFQPAYNFGYTGTGDYTTWTGITAPQLNSIGRKTVYEEYYRDNRYSSSNVYSIGNNTNRLNDGTILNDTLKNAENGINNLKIDSHKKNENLTSKENNKENVISSTSNKNTLNSSNCDNGLCDYNTKKGNDTNSDDNNNSNSCNNNNNNNHNSNDNNEQNNSSTSATQNKSWASVVSAPLSSSSSTTSSSSVIITSMNSNFKKPHYTKQNFNFSNQSQVSSNAAKLNLSNSSSIITYSSNSRQRSTDFQNSNITNQTQIQNNAFNSNSNLMNGHFYRHYNNSHSHVQNGLTYNHSNFISNRIATTNQIGKSTTMCNTSNDSNNNSTSSTSATSTTTTTNYNNINNNGNDPKMIINNETNNNNNEEKKNSYLNQLKLKNQYNPQEFDLVPKGARFFVIKSYSEDDVHRSIKYNIWCSTEHGNRRLDQAFREREGKGPVYLFFSVNGSGHFCGMAEMMSCVDYDSKSDVWSQDKWKGKFEVKWIYVKDVPNSQLRNIRLENNENKPVTNSRDTQEIPFEKGKQVLKVFHQFHNSTSIFDDFEHYEKRQDENFKKYDTVNDLNFQS